MAWTAPRTWVTAEVVTAALMNTHVRDNLLETASAKVTTAGDLVYATAANALTRLGIGAATQFLVGGASVPVWTNTIQGGPMIVADTDRQYRMHDSDDADDTSDYIAIGKTDALFNVQHFDDSTSTLTTLMAVERDDFILHTGTDAQGAGAVVIETTFDAGATAATTSGLKFLGVTITTGGPAFVSGHWMVEMSRSSDASVSGVSIRMREDGNNMANEFAYGTNDTGIADIIPAVSDRHNFTGSFFRRVTATDTSEYEVFITAEANSRFTIEEGFLYVQSIQYPT